MSSTCSEEDAKFARPRRKLEKKKKQKKMKKNKKKQRQHDDSPISLKAEPQKRSAVDPDMWDEGSSTPIQGFSFAAYRATAKDPGNDVKLRCFVADLKKTIVAKYLRPGVSIRHQDVAAWNTASLTFRKKLPEGKFTDREVRALFVPVLARQVRKKKQRCEVFRLYLYIIYMYMYTSIHMYTGQYG